MINFLLKNIFAFHAKLDADKGIRDIGLIESAVNAPFQTFGGQSLYPTVFDKAARLGFGLAKNHGFIDGNKRVATHAIIIFLRIHGFNVCADDDDFFRVVMNLATGEVSAEQLKIWLLANSKPFPTFVVRGTITILPSNQNLEEPT